MFPLAIGIGVFLGLVGFACFVARFMKVGAGDCLHEKTRLTTIFDDKVELCDHCGLMRLVQSDGAFTEWKEL